VREDEHAELSVRHRLPRVRVEALDDDVVLGEVDARSGLALGCEGRAHLGEPVVVEGVDPEARLELGAGGRVLCAGLAPEAAEPER
jgi:hypothetical protein